MKVFNRFYKLYIFLFDIFTFNFVFVRHGLFLLYSSGCSETSSVGHALTSVSETCLPPPPLFLSLPLPRAGTKGVFYHIPQIYIFQYPVPNTVSNARGSVIFVR